MLHLSMQGRHGTYLVLAAVAGTFASAGMATYLYVTGSPLLAQWCDEDGIVENLTAAMYFAAAAMFIYACAGLRFRSLVHWGYAALFFVVAAEEISWGQRLLGLETPERVAAVNVQGEINLHNLAMVNGDVRWMALLLVLGITVGVPLTVRFVPRVRALAQRLHAPVFPILASPIVLVAIAVMAGPRLAGNPRFGMDEVGEFLLAMAFLIFGLSVLAADRPAAAVAPATGRTPEAAPLEDGEDELLAMR